MSTAEDLRAAARVIETKGWTQDTWEDASGRVCVMGALHYATLGEVWGDTCTRYAKADVYRLDLATNAVTTYIGNILSWWNDRRETTAELVIKSLYACADALDDPEDQR